MLLFSRSLKKLFVLVLFILSLIPLLAKILPLSEENKAKNEIYDEGLRKISSLDKLSAYAEETYLQKKNTSSFDTLQYVTNLSDIVRQRFYHEDLKYSFSENWIAWLAGKLVWSHISFIVLSDDILKHSEAICSQQTSVFMETLQKKGITVRSVALGYAEGPGHYLCEVRYSGEWHLYDVSIEPDWAMIEKSHMSLDYYLIRKELLYQAYEKRLQRPLFDKMLERHTYGDINKLPARNMKLLHQVMNLGTYLLPLALGLLLFVLNKKKSTEKREEKILREEKQNDLILVK